MMNSDHPFNCGFCGATVQMIVNEEIPTCLCPECMAEYQVLVVRKPWPAATRKETRDRLRKIVVECMTEQFKEEERRGCGIPHMGFGES